MSDEPNQEAADEEQEHEYEVELTLEYTAFVYVRATSEDEAHDLAMDEYISTTDLDTPFRRHVDGVRLVPERA